MYTNNYSSGLFNNVLITYNFITTELHIAVFIPSSHLVHFDTSHIMPSEREQTVVLYSEEKQISNKMAGNISS